MNEQFSGRAADSCLGSDVTVDLFPENVKFGNGTVGQGQLRGVGKKAFYLHSACAGCFEK